MNVPTSAFHQHDGVIGPTPTVWCGVDVPDGDALSFAMAGVGSVYTYIDTTNDVAVPFTKVKNDAADNDWSRGIGVIRQTVAYSDFTDVTTTGTLALDTTIPIGAFTLGSSLTNLTGFTGGSNTSATLTVGVAAGDVDRYHTGTPNVFVTADAIDMGVHSGAPSHTVATTITMVVTVDSDYTTIAAGGFTISVYYLL